MCEVHIYVYNITILRNYFILIQPTNLLFWTQMFSFLLPMFVSNEPEHQNVFSFTVQCSFCLTSLKFHLHYFYCVHVNISTLQEMIFKNMIFTLFTNNLQDHEKRFQKVAVLWFDFSLAEVKNWHENLKWYRKMILFPIDSNLTTC